MVRSGLIFGCLLLLSGCSLVGGQSLHHFFIFVLSLVLFGCNEHFKVRKGNNQNPGGDSSDSGIEVPDFLPPNTLYIPHPSDLASLSSETIISTTEKNYLLMDKTTERNLNNSGIDSDDLVVIGQENPFTITVDLGDGDDVLFFEDYKHYSKFNGYEFNLGAGDDHLVVGGARFDDYMGDSVILGAGIDRVYISPLENESTILMNLNEDKIVLTNGLDFADLRFRDTGSEIIISMKDPMSGWDKDIEIVLLRVRGASLAQVSDENNYEQRFVVEARRGVYDDRNSKFPKNWASWGFQDYLIGLNVKTQNFDSASWQLNVMNEWGDPVTQVSYNNLWEEYVMDEQVVDFGTHSYRRGVHPLHYSSVSTLTAFSQTINNRNVTLGQTPLASRAPGGWAPPWWMDPDIPGIGELNISSNITTRGTQFFFNYETGMRVASHYNDTSSLYNNQGELTVYLGGKSSGMISDENGTGLHLIVSREGGNATVVVRDFDNFSVTFGDNIKYSDLQFKEDSDGYVHVQIIDDMNKPITLFKFAPGETLENLSNPALYVTLPNAT